ncbi:Rpn family recombination-promoting nuclease/putative transposase [Selenomonas sp. KH1T6]|uniref:Rpn family recombination-promoting nuclease/putative transposase n=1 Tax=Selenomonas sp. KH1T6 TaxID=3158784 RepID=UPI0008A733BC|nr:conserved hypothetical protein (putative transposase or invertase) [Selenomonas ruminantium]
MRKDKPSSKTPQVSVSETPMTPVLSYEHKEWEDLTIADDYMFKLVMSHKRICKHLLEMILGIKIRKLMDPKTEHAMKNSYESNGIRLDVYVEDDENTVYDVEMQIRKYSEAYFGRRTRYYQSVIDFGALQVGVKYHKLKKSIIIFICPFALFDKKHHLFTFKNTCQEDTSILLDDGTSKVFLCTQGTLDDVSPEVKNFLAFVEGLPVKDVWVDKVKDLIDKLKQDERKKADYMTYQMKIEEEREAVREEERQNAILTLIKTLKDLSIEKSKVIEQLIKQYSMSELEAQAAVQANW